MYETAAAENAPALGSHDPQQLWEALQQANIPTLLMVLTHLTGDRRWLGEPYTPSRPRGMDDNDSGGLEPRLQDEIRRTAYEAILTHPEAPPPDKSVVTEMMTASMGEPIPEEYADMILEETGLTPRQPTWPAEPDPARLAATHVLVIGAGVSGICAAVALQRAGIPYTVVERNASIGGTWFENTYPGCGVDTPSHLYSFSFAPWNWSQYFAKQSEIHAYLEHVVESTGIRDNIVLQTAVSSAAFDEITNSWTVEAIGPNGITQTFRSTAVISAVGQLNIPATPNLPGAERFRGSKVHSARWPADLDVTDRSVAIIGAGASAMQIVPAIAGTASDVTIFQRSPHWASPNANYRRDVPAALRYLFEHVPAYAAWYRARLCWSFADKVHASLIRDPEWQEPQAINATNDRHRRYFTRHITEQLGDRTDLMSQVLPQYPPFGKRMLIDNQWYRTLTRPDVGLVTCGIRELVANGIVDGNGDYHPADIVVYATGFDTLRMIASYDLRGRGGTSLRSVWRDDDARAYLGVSVPGFPNFFCLYGPNTGLGHGGSLISITECTMRYITVLIQRMITERVGAVEVRPEAFERYNQQLDIALARSIWSEPGVDNWYRNDQGRVVTNSPWRIVDYWRLLHDPDLADYHITQHVESSVAQ